MKGRKEVHEQLHTHAHNEAARQLYDKVRLTPWRITRELFGFDLMDQVRGQFTVAVNRAAKEAVREKKDKT